MLQVNSLNFSIYHTAVLAMAIHVVIYTVSTSLSYNWNFVRFETHHRQALATTVQWVQLF